MSAGSMRLAVVFCILELTLGAMGGQPDKLIRESPHAAADSQPRRLLREDDAMSVVEGAVAMIGRDGGYDLGSSPGGEGRRRSVRELYEYYDLDVPEETPSETPGETTPAKTMGPEGPEPTTLPPAPPKGCYKVTVNIATKPFAEAHWDDPESGTLANIKDLLGSLSGDGQVQLMSTSKISNFFFEGCTMLESGIHMRDSNLVVTTTSAENVLDLVESLMAADEFSKSLLAVDEALCGVQVLRHSSRRIEDPEECQVPL